MKEKSSLIELNMALGDELEVCDILHANTIKSKGRDK